VILAGPGNDTVYGNEGADQLTGGPGRDTLYGDETPDTESPEADHGPGDPDLIDAATERRTPPWTAAAASTAPG
jgi:Ca2+-binding RTX toxin-like protein